MADVRVADVMTRDVVVLKPKDTIHDGAQRLARKEISGAPVVAGDEVVGVVSESDLINAVMPRARADRGVSVLDLLSVIGRGRFPKHEVGIRIEDVMTTSVITLTPDTSIWKAASTMEQRGVKRLPVVDRSGHLVGIVSRADVVKAMALDDAEIEREVAEAVEALGTETIDDFEVTVVDGVTTLRGEADRSSTKALAFQIAGRVPGVVKVVNRLTSIIDDSHIAKIKLETDPKDPRLDWREDETVNRGAR